MKSTLLLSFALLSCFSLSSGQADEHPVTFKIGVIQSLTGIAQKDGESVLRALQLAKEKINNGSGPKIELLVEDDGTLPKNSALAFRKLLNEKVDAMIAGTWA